MSAITGSPAEASLAHGAHHHALPPPVCTSRSNASAEYAMQIESLLFGQPSPQRARADGQPHDLADGGGYGGTGAAPGRASGSGNSGLGLSESELESLLLSVMHASQPHGGANDGGAGALMGAHGGGGPAQLPHSDVEMASP
jgi:hypothetical protein